MRKTSLTAAAALLGVGLAAPAFAQSNSVQPAGPQTAGPQSEMIRAGHEPGVGDSEPASGRASNIDRADARSTIAPRLPSPRAGDAASPDQYLRDAEQALNKHQTGQAQEALERAQTRMLDRSVEASQTATPDADPRVQTVEQARQALGHGDTKGAVKLVGQALAMNTGAAGASSEAGGQDMQGGMRAPNGQQAAPRAGSRAAPPNGAGASGGQM